MCFKPQINSNDHKMSKNQIYEKIQALNEWYTKGYVSYWNVTQKWYLSGRESSKLKKQFSKEQYNHYVNQRLLQIDSLNFFTASYIKTIKSRLKRKGKYNEAMILTNHEFGNMVNSFLVKRMHMDGIPAFWPEANIFHDPDMSDSAYIEWHKNRITLLDDNKAKYKVFYGEVGDSQNSNPDGHGDYHIVEIAFLNQSDGWKINNIEIKEQTREQAEKFYNENIKRRGF